jgi:hypothetical protein
MRMRLKKLLTSAMLIFVLLLQGCSLYTPLFSTKKEGHIVVIDYPPNRISYAGDVKPKDQKLILDILKELEKRRYHPHVYPSRPGLNVDSNIEHIYKNFHKQQFKIK